ncbi:TonB-dependent siderophore receptor [Parapedomonas caeni]
MFSRHVAFRHFLSAGVTLAVMCPAGVTLAQSASATTDAAAEAPTEQLDDIIVYGRDKVGLLETTPSETLFGLSKPLVETPRAATFVSEATIQRYGIEEVDDLIAIAPGAFTASFYGVKGSVNLRGTLAETYYRGFKRIENRGTYQTPLAAASQIEILRGPPTSIFGPGKVGGFLNITPQGGRKANGQLIDSLTGDVEATVGSYGKFNVAGNLGVPVSLGTVEGAVQAYAEYENSDSFYRGIHPEHKIFQLTGDFDFNERLNLTFGGLIYRSEGYIQTPGWNRLTQELIDSGTYITGRDTTIADTDGNGRISPTEIGGSLVAGYFGYTPTPNARFTLDEGVGTTKLDRRTVFVSDADFSDSRTNTFYLGLTQALGERARVRLQGFYDDLENKRFVSYGFPAWYDARVFEVRGSVEFPLDVAALGLESRHAVGAGYRDYDGTRKESFNSGYLAIDRRDLAYGPTAGDVFDDPFRNPAISWDNDIHSRWTDSGLFLQSDLTFANIVNVMLGARYDWYDLDTHDSGARTGNAIITGATDGGDFTYNASISLKSGIGLIPYFTYAKSSALEGSQAGDISPVLISRGQWLSDSDLKEAGLKFDLFSHSLVGALSAYKQNRTRLSSTNSVVATTGKGVELEARWLINDNFSATFAGNVQKTTIEGPDAGFIYIPAYVTGLSGDRAYGGTYAVYNFSTSAVGYAGDYELRSIPRSTLSLFGSYITDPRSWGQAGGTIGITRVSSTATRLAEPVVFPAYTLANVSAFITVGRTQLTANINNLFDKRYFQPAADTYVNMAALPGKGREWRLTLKHSF